MTDDEKEIRDIGIIGAGMAGLTAALYAARAGKSVTVFEGGAVGGQIISSPEITNYPALEKASGTEIASVLLSQALGAEAEMIDGKAREISFRGAVKRVLCRGKTYSFKALIIASGAEAAKLDVVGEEKYNGRGVSYCAYCDGPLFKGKNVAVAGGGASAAEYALYLSGTAKKVYLIHRSEKFRAPESDMKRISEKENITVMTGSVICGLKGDGVLRSIVVKDKNEGTVSELESDALFVAIGRKPEKELYSSFLGTDEKGFILADEQCRTSLDGVFAAGDCRKKKVRQLCTASSDGAVSALSACAYIDGTFGRKTGMSSFSLLEL